MFSLELTQALVRMSEAERSWHDVLQRLEDTINKDRNAVVPEMGGPLDFDAEPGRIFHYLSRNVTRTLSDKVEFADIAANGKHVTLQQLFDEFSTDNRYLMVALLRYYG